MSNYTKTTNFAAKDSLPSGNAGKIVKGTEIDAEFNNIATASATKADINDVTLTGTTTFGSLNDGTITITGWVDEDNMSSNSAVLVPTQQSVKAYVDSTTTAQDLDVTDGSASIDIDLDSESLGILGGTGVTSTASGTGVTLAIDSTVATLTGTQTLTNKTLTTPTILTSFTIGSATISEAELEILDGATVTTAELNVLDGITSTTAELNILDGVTSTAAEINILDGVTSTTAELNILDGVTSSATELNILDGVTSTTAELNILDGVTSTTAELNILDGVTSTTAELNILDGVTSTTTELNLLDGVTATTAELNYTDGVTSAIQTQLDSKISGADAALTGNVTITTADDTTQLALISTSADANAGPILDLFRNSVSAADNDLTGQVYFSGKNDADEKTYYGQITSQITDVSNGSEDFKLELSTLTAGSSNSRLLVTPTETVFNEQSADLDFRIESDGNTNAFFLEGSSGNVSLSNNLTVSGTFSLPNADATNEISFTGTEFTNVLSATTSGFQLGTTGAGYLQFLTGNTARMTIDGATGNTGIGTGTTVNRKLEVAGNNNGGAKANYIRITDTDTSATANNQAGGIEFFTNDVTAGIAASMEVLYAGSGGGGEITFNTNASSSGTLTEALRITESGNVLVGTTASGSEGLNLSNGFNLGFSEGANSSLVNLFRQTSSGSSFLGSGYRYSDTANKAESSYAGAWARSAITAGYADVEFFVDAEATVAVGTDITPTKRVTVGVNGMGIGQTDTTAGALSIQANSGAGGIAITGRASGGIGGIGFYDDNGTTGVGYIQGRADDAQLRLWGQQSNGTVSIGQNNTERLQITATGLVYSSVQYIGGFGAQTTGGTTNFNDASNALSGNAFTLLRGDATNGPGGTAYYHVFNYEYVSKNGSGNMTQLAYGYNDNKAYMRYRLSGSWSAWAALH